MDEYKQLLDAYDRIQEIKYGLINGLIELDLKENNLLYIELVLKELIIDLLRDNTTHNSEEVHEVLKAVDTIKTYTKTKKMRIIIQDYIKKNQPVKEMKQDG